MQSSKKQSRERNRRSLHIKRVSAEIKSVGGLHIASTVCEARVLLNDIEPKGIGLFSEAPMMVGQQIALTIEEPKRFYIRGRIVWCQECDAGSHVLSKKKFSYRIGIEFTFESPAEEKAVKDYCEELARDHLYPRAG